jgi:hypothetical protein
LEAIFLNCNQELSLEKEINNLKKERAKRGMES